MAQQSAPVRRKVAIKIIKHGMSSKNVLARFEAERQALAIMEHPNITRIFDAGIMESGRPYFVMELVTGLPITQYCEQKQLSLRQRMELFFKVCNAVQHAHQKGIIHRDIKPSNIMVTQFDGVAVPKIIDFGIAKAIDQPLTEKTLFTSYGNMIGTPEYMSPEQAEMNGLDIDTCSDVYSLGVVLYELLTGTTPFYHHKNSGLRKICQAICTEEPELASTRVNNLAETVKKNSSNRGADNRGLTQFLRGDVDWILAKCLGKRREDRYATAADLAADVHRYLEGEPIEAAGPSKTYRLKKFARRHRAAMVLASVVLFSLVAATLVSTAFAIRATNAEQLATSRLQDVDKARKEAVIERDRAREAEMKLTELERASRREAANAQAVVRFINQVKGDGNKGLPQPTPSDVSDPQVEDVKEVPFDVTVAPNGNISIAGEGGQFSLLFDDQENGGVSKNNKTRRIHVHALGLKNRQQAQRALVLVTDEMQKKFGKSDLFVAEPKMMLAEIFVEDKNWPEAETHLREIGKILDDNFAGKELKSRNELLLGLTIAMQGKKEEARKLITANLAALENNKEIKATFREAIEEIQVVIADANEEISEELESVNEELTELGDEIMAELFDSLEEAFEERLEKLEIDGMKVPSPPQPKPEFQGRKLP